LNEVWKWKWKWKWKWGGIAMTEGRIGGGGTALSSSTVDQLDRVSRLMMAAAAAAAMVMV